MKTHPLNNRQPIQYYDYAILIIKFAISKKYESAFYIGIQVFQKNKFNFPTFLNIYLYV